MHVDLSREEMMHIIENINSGAHHLAASITAKLSPHIRASARDPAGPEMQTGAGVVGVSADSQKTST